MNRQCQLSAVLGLRTDAMAPLPPLPASAPARRRRTSPPIASTPRRPEAPRSAPTPPARPADRRAAARASPAPHPPPPQPHACTVPRRTASSNPLPSGSGRASGPATPAPHLTPHPTPHPSFQPAVSLQPIRPRRHAAGRVRPGRPRAALHARHGALGGRPPVKKGNPYSRRSESNRGFAAQRAPAGALLPAQTRALSHRRGRACGLARSIRRARSRIVAQATPARTPSTRSRSRIGTGSWPTHRVPHTRAAAHAASRVRILRSRKRPHAHRA
jgi:hypothetical protein